MDDFRNECVHCGSDIILLQEECDDCQEQNSWEILTSCNRCGSTVDYANDDRCDSCGTRIRFWRIIEELNEKYNQHIKVDRENSPDPCSEGYRSHFGFPKKQDNDYRRIRPKGGDYHIVLYNTHYELHKDRISAISAPVTHGFIHGVIKTSNLFEDSARHVFSLIMNSEKLKKDTLLESKCPRNRIHKNLKKIK